MTSESAVALFGSQGVPLVVRDQIAHVPSGPIGVAAVKVVFMLSGWARVQSPASEALLRAGSILTIPPELTCLGFPIGHARTITFYIQPNYLADQIRWLPASHPLVHQLHHSLHATRELQTLQLPASAMEELTLKLARTANTPEGSAYDFALLAGVSEVFDAVGRLAGSFSGCARGERRLPGKEVLTAIALLHEDLGRSWRIDDLAREVSLSISQLSRLFRTQAGISPAAFLRQIRAARMAELLATTSLTVGEAGAAVGWHDLSIASRSFKHRYGVSPSAYASLYRTSLAA